MKTREQIIEEYFPWKEGNLSIPTEELIRRRDAELKFYSDLEAAAARNAALKEKARKEAGRFARFI